MPVTLESLGIEQLSVRERLELIDQIWDSLPESVEPQELPQPRMPRIKNQRLWRAIAALRSPGSPPPSSSERA